MSLKLKSFLRVGLAGLALSIFLAVPTVASAAISSTAVTSPAAAGATVNSLTDTTAVAGNALTMTVSDTATGQAPGDTVDLRCWFKYMGTGSFGSFSAPGLATDDVTGAWSFTGDLKAVVYQPCELIAVPSGTLPTAPLGSFTGPTMLLSLWHQDKISSGVNVGKINDYGYRGSHSKGFNDFFSPTDCGYCDGSLITGDASSGFNESEYVFYDNQYWSANNTPFGTGREALLIDTINALDPYEAGSTLPGFQPLQVSVTRAAGVDTIVEIVPFMKCAPNSSYSSASCTSLVTLPV